MLVNLSIIRWLVLNKHRMYILFVVVFFLQFSVPVVSMEAGVPVFKLIDKDDFVVNEPLLVEFTIKNILKYEVELDLGHNRESNFVVVVHDLKNNKSYGPTSLDSSGFGRIGKMKLAKGEDYSTVLVLNKWFNGFEVGEYRIEIRLKNNSSLEKKLNGKLFSGDFTVNIGKRNPEKLTALCEKYLNSASQSQDVSVVGFSSLALSYVNDPLAVPFLIKLFENNKVARQNVLAGLSRIKNAEAVRFLIDVQKREISDTSELARDALTSIYEESKSEEVKELIEKNKMF